MLAEGLLVSHVERGFYFVSHSFGVLFYYVYVVIQIIMWITPFRVGCITISLGWGVIIHPNHPDCHVMIRTELTVVL